LKRAHTAFYAVANVALKAPLHPLSWPLLRRVVSCPLEDPLPVQPGELRRVMGGALINAVSVAIDRDCRHRDRRLHDADTTTPAGKLVLTIMAGVIQFERARIKERQCEGMEAASAKGFYKGGTRRLSEREIRRMHADGMGATEIMRDRRQEHVNGVSCVERN
jgi:hypothetical protein